MASGLYTACVNAWLTNSTPVNLASGGDTLIALLVRTSLSSGTPYSVSLAADDYLPDIPDTTTVRPIAGVTLTSQSVALRVFDGGDVVFPSVPSSTEAIQAIVLYKEDTTVTTSRLIAFFDSASVSGLPVTPNGQNINLTWDSGANKIFAL